jgi:hypothetical protein
MELSLSIHLMLPLSLLRQPPPLLLPLDMSLWHRRLGHIGVRNVQRMVTNDLVTGLHLNDSTPVDPICEPCIHGKQHRDPFPQQRCSLSTAPLQLIHSDVHEVKVPTASGLKCWVTFDDYSTHYTVIPLKKKSDVSLLSSLSRLMLRIIMV